MLQPRFGPTRNKAILGYAFASLSQALDSRTDARGYRVFDANGVVPAHFYACLTARLLSRTPD